MLRFLRKRKFSITQALDTLEKNLILRQTYSNWYCNLDTEHPKIQALLDTEYAVLLKDRDEFGRKILIVTPSCLNPDKFTSTDIVRYLSVVFEYILCEEITQVAGLIFVIDGSNLSMKLLSLFSLMELKTIFSTIQDAVPVRLKEYHVVNLPSFASTIVEIIIKVFSAKMQKRVFFSKNIEEFQKRINPKILPKEYGGSIPKADYVREFKEKIVDFRQRILNVDKHIITDFKTSKSNYNSTFEANQKEMNGTFKKLDLD